MILKAVGFLFDPPQLIDIISVTVVLGLFQFSKKKVYSDSGVYLHT